MRARLPHVVLSGATALVLGGALLLSLGLAERSRREAEADLLRAEAGAAAALLQQGVDAAAVDRLLRSRWAVLDTVEPLLDRPEVREGPGGMEARTALYAGDGWTVVGTLRVRPPEVPRTPSRPLRLPLLALSLLAILLASVLPRVPLRPLAGIVAVAVAVVPEARWSLQDLAALTDARLALAAAAVEEGAAGGRGAVRAEAARTAPHPGAAADTGAAAAAVPDVGWIARAADLPFLVRGAGGGVGATTLLPGTARELAAPTSPPPPRVRVRSAPYALADAEGVRLAMVPYEHTASPLARLAGVGLAALLLAALLEALRGLASRPRELRRNLVAWSFLAPATLHLAVFTAGPLLFAAWLSLHRWSLVERARPFVGLANYAGLLRDSGFWRAMANTAVFTLHVPVAMAVALAFALLVHRRARGIVWVRAALFLPGITSLVAVAIVWQWMLNGDYGLFNWVLSRVGLGPVPWLTSPRTALLSLMVLAVWLVVGYQMVLFQAGLAAIPEELYEAARIDGAGPWARFRHVTLPGLRHTLFFVLVTSVIGSFQVFGIVYVMTEGGPLGATDVAVYHIYREAWEFLRFGNAAAMSWILFALVFGVTWLHFRVLERRAEA